MLEIHAPQFVAGGLCRRGEGEGVAGRLAPKGSRLRPLEEYRLSCADKLALGIARAGGAGLVPHAPGTWGTALALLLAPLYFLPMPLIGRVLVLMLLFVVGAAAAGRTESLLGCKDPGQVVIDEVLGMWLTLLPFDTASPLLLFLGFVLFRFFDILKPWPVRASEDWLRGGYGVMLDDAVGGCMAMCCLLAVHYGLGI